MDEYAGFMLLAVREDGLAQSMNCRGLCATVLGLKGWYSCFKFSNLIPEFIRIIQDNLTIFDVVL